MFEMTAYRSNESGTFRNIKTTLTVASHCGWCVQIKRVGPVKDAELVCFRKDVDPEEKIEFKTRLGESQHHYPLRNNVTPQLNLVNPLFSACHKIPPLAVL